MMRTMIAALLALLAALAPLAAAQAEDEKNETSERPDDAAWVDDCPPDMMCAYQEPETSDPDPKPSQEEPTAPSDCGGEVCAYDEPTGEPAPEERPNQYGPEDCIECSQPPREDEPAQHDSTCMDGQQEGEVCDDDVYYMDGPTRGPDDGSCENCRGDDADAGSESPPVTDASPISAPDDGAEGDGGITSVKDDEVEKKSAVPGPALALGIVAIAGAAVLMVSRR